jgi:AraC family transcriptional regulator
MRSLTLRDYEDRLSRVLLHIQEHLDEPLPLDELASVACFSPFHFHRVFTGMVGESVKEHIRRLRLERAASRLKLSSASVIQIALDAGYDSHEAFTRSFKAAFGASPSQYRSQRASKDSSAPSGVHNLALESDSRFRARRRGGRMKVEIKHVPPMRVAFCRHVGPYDEVGSAWDKLLTILGADGRLGGGATMLGVCYDDPETTPPSEVRYDACLTVDPDFVPAGEVGVQEIAAGDYAMTTHFGPYNKLGQTYSRLLGQWLPRSGRELRNAPCFEVYLNDPQSTAPEDLLTDIYAPLQPLDAQ